MPSQPLKFTIKLYTDHKNLWFKHTTHQKAASLRASSLWKLENMVNTNSVFNQSVLNSLQKGTSSLIFTNLLLQTTIPTIFIKNLFLHFNQFSPPYFPLLVHKTILTIPSSLFVSYCHLCNLYTKSIFPSSAMGVFRGMTLF